jgi:hypothetical protein
VSTEFRLTRKWNNAYAAYEYSLSEWSPVEQVWMFRVSSHDEKWARRNALHHNIEILDA